MSLTQLRLKVRLSLKRRRQPESSPFAQARELPCGCRFVRGKLQLRWIKGASTAKALYKQRISDYRLACAATSPR